MTLTVCAEALIANYGQCFALQLIRVYQLIF